MYRNTAILFARVGRRFIEPRPVTLLGEPFEWVDTICYVRVTLEKGLTWSLNIDQVRKKTAQRMGMLVPLLNRKSDLSVRNLILVHKHIYPPHNGLHVPLVEICSSLPYHEATSVTIQVSSPCYWFPLVRK